MINFKTDPTILAIKYSDKFAKEINLNNKQTDYLFVQLCKIFENAWDVVDELEDETLGSYDCYVADCECECH